MAESSGEASRPRGRFSSTAAAPTSEPHPPVIPQPYHTHAPSQPQQPQSQPLGLNHPQRRSLSHSFSHSFSHPIPAPARSPSPSSSSTSSRYYSPTSTPTPYPVVYSSPSLIDSARSSAHYRYSYPHSPPLYSSPFNDPLGESHSTASIITDPLSSTTDPDYFFPPLVLPTHPHSAMSSSQQEPAPSSPQPSPAALTMDTAQSHSHAPTEDLESGQASQRLEAQSSEAEDEADATTPRPRSVVDFAIDSANANPAGRRVRRNMIARLRSRWENVPRNSRIILCLTGSMTVAKVAATIVVLIVDRHADCTLLKVLLILYASRSAIGLPFTVYTHLHPRVQGAPLTTHDILLERQRTLMEIAGTCLFFLSNYFLFTQPACRQEAPALFYMTIAYVVLGYVVILVPILLCLAVILCLPLVLRVMRALDLGPVVGVKGATEEMIAAIPIVKYRRPVVVEQEGDGGVQSPTISIAMQSSVDPAPAGGAGTDHIETTTSTAAGAAAVPTLTPQNSGLPISNSSSISVPPSRPKRSFFSLFQRSKKGALSGSEKSADKPSTQTTPVEYLTLEDAQDAVCAICLCDYEDEEELRKMKCSHYFHKDCVDEWLRLHRNCPLCKRDIEELSGLREGAASSSPSPSPVTVSAPERSILAPLVRTLSSPTRPA